MKTLLFIINILFIGLTAYFVYLFGLFYLGGEDEFVGSRLYFLCGRFIWSLIIALMGLAFVISLTKLFSWLSHKYSESSYPELFVKKIAIVSIVISSLLSFFAFI